jgi:toxin FitB
VTYLVDTNVISELRKRAPNSSVEKWFSSCPPNNLYLSVLTLGEIRKGIELLSDESRKQAYGDWLAKEIPAFFSGRILQIDARICDRWGRMSAAAGRTLPVIDSLLAASAVEHGLTLVTRNVKDFIGLPVTTIDPWISN